MTFALPPLLAYVPWELAFVPVAVHFYLIGEHMIKPRNTRA